MPSWLVALAGLLAVALVAPAHGGERRSVWQSGFARVRCRKCPEEFLVAFSCRGRGLCPSCGAKRAAELGAFLLDEVVEEVGHTQWVFTVPKMLRVFFLHHRELLGELSRAGYETVEELMSAAALGEKGFRPGVVSVVQTFGERANFHPHVHALVSRGGWTGSGEWVPVAYVDERAAEEVLRHKVLALLRRRGLAERGADRASPVMDAKRLLRSQPGLGASWRWTGVRGPGA